MRTILAGVVLCAMSLAAAEEKSPPAERPPGFVLGYNKDASGSIEGSCRPAEKGTIVCDFTEVLFFPPDTKEPSKDEQQIIADARKDPEKAKQDMAANAKKMRDAREKGNIVMGPKGRQNFDDLLKAVDSGDPARMAHALTERDRHTCHLFVYTYTPKFHRIGMRKWLSDRHPKGRVRWSRCGNCPPTTNRR
jgi:hypothetical protein